jgi:hypothetical protein
MGYLRHIREKAHYNPLPRLALDALIKMGLRIEPFHLFEEGSPEVPLPEYEADLEGFEVSLLGAADMQAMAAVPYRWIPLATLQDRLDRGDWCLAAKRSGELAIFMWCCFTECHFKGLRFPMRRDEAYIYDTHTLTAFRGQGLAPAMRCELYRRLGEQGRTRFYSITNRYNTSSCRFKQKLHARIVCSGTYVQLFRKWDLISRQGRPNGIPPMEEDGTD